MEPRNYESGAAGSPPTVPASPSTGYPTGGDPQTATPATKPGAHWFYKIGESLRNVITNAGLTPDDGDLSLLQKAIVKLVSATNHVVRLEDVTFGPSVADGDAVYWDNANSRYDQAIANGTDKQKMVGFADVTNSLVEAFGRSALFSGLTAGTRYYLSDSAAGAITATAPVNKVVVGKAKSPTTMFVDVDEELKTHIGEEQTWQDVTASRVLNTVYTNTTGRAIQLSINTNIGDASGYSQLNVGGVPISRIVSNNAVLSGGQTLDASIQAIVPNGQTYEITTSGSGTSSIRYWAELR